MAPLHPPVGSEVLGRRSLYPALLEREPVSRSAAHPGLFEALPIST